MPWGFLQAQDDRLMVFLDCNTCDQNFILQEMNFVNYARDPQLADVHVLVTRQQTGSGGLQYEISYIGKKDFQGVTNEITFTTETTQTFDEIRTVYTRMIKVGLVPYLSKTSLASNIEVKIDQPKEDSKKEQKVEDDFWNNWIFEVYGSGYLRKESQRSNLQLSYGFDADRVTENWRITSSIYFNFDEREVTDGDDVFTANQQRHGFNSRVARSLSDHWSAGAYGDIYTNTYRNINMHYRLSPAIEYSIFPYSEVMRREITIIYRMGFIRQDYIEPTIFEKMEEDLVNQSLAMRVRIRQPWGSLFAGLEGSHFMHDTSKNRLEFDCSLNVRVFKGLSVRFSGGYEIIRDQLYLAQGGNSLEDILLQQRQLATAYDMRLSAGLSYSFGALFNNIVNTRL